MADAKGDSPGEGAGGSTQLRLHSLNLRDFSGSENTIPLPSQWLVSKLGDGKPPASSMDPPGVLGSVAHGKNIERWRGDGVRDADKRKDWWRSMSTEAENAYPERRREEERENSSSFRRDRWKEGEKDASQPRRGDRWSENSSLQELGEGKRLPSDHWPDSVNREARRDNKWSSRWGPEDKDKDNRREKWSEPEKEAGGYRDRHVTALGSRMDSDRESDSSRDRDRIWRPHSFAPRGRLEAPPAPPKFAPGFGVGRGRDDSPVIGFAAGRGRANFTGSGLLLGPPSIHVGAPPLKLDVGQDFRYPRAKLLDICRRCFLSSFPNLPEGFTESPPLTQAEPLEPLAFITPCEEEKLVLEGIWKGDIISSGAVHSTSKDASSNRSREGTGRACGRGKTTNSLGDKEKGFLDNARVDCFYPSSVSEITLKDGIFSKQVVTSPSDEDGDIGEAGKCQEKKTNSEGSSKDEIFYRGSCKEVDNWEKGILSCNDGIWRQNKAGEMKDQRSWSHDEPTNQQNQGWFPDHSIVVVDSSRDEMIPKLEEVLEQEVESEQTVSEVQSSTTFKKNPVCVDEVNSVAYVEKHEVLRRDTELMVQSSAIVASSTAMDGLIAEDQSRRDDLKRGYQQSTPEEISLFYTDPQGEIQGPFFGDDIIGWFEAGYFGTDLPVRLADAPGGTPFMPLESVMPHLKVKACVPSGFDASKQFEELEDNTDKASVGGKFSSQTTPNSTGQETTFSEPKVQILQSYMDVVGKSMEAARNSVRGDSQLALNSPSANFKDGTLDQMFELPEGTLGGKADPNQEKIFSLKQKISAFPFVESEDSDALVNQITRAGHRAPISNVTSQHPETISPFLESLASHSVPSVPSSERTWPNLIHGELPQLMFPRGAISPFQAHQMEQLEKQRLQQWYGHPHLEIPFQNQIQQQQQPMLSQVRRQQPGSGAPFLEQFQHSGRSQDFNLNLLQQQLPTPHQWAQPQSPHVPIPPGLALDQLLRLQQQQLPPQVLSEQLLRQHQEMSTFDQFHPQTSVGTLQYGQLDQSLFGRVQESSIFDSFSQPHLLPRNTMLDHNFQARHTRDMAFEQFLLQHRGQEEQYRQSSHDRRVSGVWKVDEYGHFIPTQASAPMHSMQLFEQQPHCLQHQSSPRLPKDKYYSKFCLDYRTVQLAQEHLE